MDYFQQWSLPSYQGFRTNRAIPKPENKSKKGNFCSASMPCSAEHGSTAVLNLPIIPQNDAPDRLLEVEWQHLAIMHGSLELRLLILQRANSWAGGDTKQKGLS